LGFLNNKDN